MYARLFAGTLLLTVFVMGCSGSSIKQAEVSGTVSYKGKPLPGGVITFVSPRGYTGTAVIDPQGHYKMPQAPVGEVQIGVDNRMLTKRGAASAKKGMLKLPPEVASKQQNPQAVTGTYVFLPPKFAAPDKSGLNYTVKPGTQTHDIDLSNIPGAAPAAPGS